MSITSRKEQWHLPIINHLKLADVVTTTTPIFAKIIKKHNKNVYVLPNAINPDDDRFKLKDIKSDKLRFGIICGSSHLKDLELMRGMTAQLSKEHFLHYHNQMNVEDKKNFFLNLFLIHKYL